jgi:hypothetical protein
MKEEKESRLVVQVSRKSTSLCLLMTSLLFLGVLRDVCLVSTASFASTSGVAVQSNLGAPTIDGWLGTNEWKGFVNLSLPIEEVLRATPPALLNVTFAAMNTAYALYMTLQVRDRLPANEATVITPPYHSNNLGLWIGDGIVRVIDSNNFSLIDYELIVESPSSIRDAARALGSAIADFNAADPSRPYGAAGFQYDSGQSGRGTYTFEMAFPYTTQPAFAAVGQQPMFMGLCCVPRYRLWAISFGEWGNNGTDTYHFNYQLPRYGAPEDEWLYVVAAVDPTPLILLTSGLSGLAVAAAVSILFLRRRRRRLRHQD